MKRKATSLRLCERGAAAAEFALVAPVLILLIVGIAQLGTLFMANAGLRNAIGEGARYATIYPRPTNAEIQERITDTRFGLEPESMTTPAISPCTSNGASCLDISASYTVTLDFVFFSLPPLTLTESRRAFVQPAAAT